MTGDIIQHLPGKEGLLLFLLLLLLITIAIAIAITIYYWPQRCQKNKGSNCVCVSS